MALGATSRSILKLVMLNVAALLIGGIVTGIGLSLAHDAPAERAAIRRRGETPRTPAISGALIAAVSLAAGLVAALRATRVDPLVALRQE
jgi:putative ABC transport system permease protein